MRAILLNKLKVKESQPTFFLCEEMGEKDRVFARWWQPTNEVNQVPRY